MKGRRNRKVGPQKLVLVSFSFFVFKMEKTCRCLYSKERRVASTGKTSYDKNHITWLDISKSNCELEVIPKIS